MATVVLLGTLDTKGREYAFLRERLLEQGVDVLVVDAGVGEPVGLWPDVANTELAGDAAELWEAHDRGDAVTAMGEGAARVVKRLHEEGRLDGILALDRASGVDPFAFRSEWDKVHKPDERYGPPKPREV